jgi:hypothetical protein
MPCALAAVSVALSGGPVADARMVTPPYGPGVHASAVGKGTYGDDLAFHLETPNFTLQWSDPTVDPTRAADLGEWLETGWTALVEEQGWPVPVSADRYRLRVILALDLGGSGYTTEYASADYPEGYPVLYLNPGFLPDDPDYERSVAVHELGHAIQYALRALDPAEAWYWEASAEWMAELGAPELDSYARSVGWYAQHPELAYDSDAALHPYGMVLLPAFLDAYAPGAFAASWHDPAPWADAIATAAGLPFPDVIADMTGAYAAHTLPESDLYADPVLLDGDEAEVEGRLGTFYVPVDPGSATWAAEGDVVVRYAVEGSWSDEAPAEPFIATITTLDATGKVRWGLVAPEEGGCGCATASARPGLPVVLLAALLRRSGRGRQRP